MVYEITADNANEMVRVCFSGTKTVDQIYKARNEVASELTRLGYRRVLVDSSRVKAKQNLSVQTLYELGSTKSKALPPRTRMALIFSPENDAVRDLEFVETVAQNRGARFKLFQDADDALNWLKSEK